MSKTMGFAWQQETKKKRRVYHKGETGTKTKTIFTDVLDLCLVEYERCFLLRAMEHRRTVTVNVYCQEKRNSNVENTLLW